MAYDRGQYCFSYSDFREDGICVAQMPDLRALGVPIPEERSLEALRRHRKHQLEEKIRASSYEDSDLVFATGKGTPLDAQNVVKRHFKPLLDRASLPPIRWHDLRHLVPH